MVGYAVRLNEYDLVAMHISIDSELRARDGLRRIFGDRTTGVWEVDLLEYVWTAGKPEYANPLALLAAAQPKSDNNYSHQNLKDRMHHLHAIFSTRPCFYHTQRQRRSAAKPVTPQSDPLLRKTVNQNKLVRDKKWMQKELGILAKPRVVGYGRQGRTDPISGSEFGGEGSRDDDIVGGYGNSRQYAVLVATKLDTIALTQGFGHYAKECRSQSVACVCPTGGDKAGERKAEMVAGSRDRT
ncbi:hypothetical protein Tco_0629036 [Tanacetum coccineum]|uniref:Uncharacterized protein n=1 Tax=Tanacetum coccineum TaxID=301880 RepID=A0ABQ4WRZ8_9ASTR